MNELNYTTNPFGGIIIDPETLPGDPIEFKERLDYSLEVWRMKGFKVAWLEVPLEKAANVPVAADSEFIYHHAAERYVQMTLQLEEGAHVPPYASHYIGAGGVVISDDRDILVVSEKHRRSRGPAYKLPGGALHPGEHLVDGVVREVLEETGVKTRFESLACFRHWHGYRYDKSDIYFVCRLSPLNTDITMQAEELDECLWLPVDDYLGDAEVSVFNKRIVRAALDSPGIVPGTIEGYGDPARFEFFLPRDAQS